MQHVLANAELFVERDRRIVAAIGLDENDPGPALRRDLAQAPDQATGDTLPAMLLANREPASGKLREKVATRGPMRLLL